MGWSPAYGVIKQLTKLQASGTEKGHKDANQSKKFYLSGLSFCGHPESEPPCCLSSMRINLKLSEATEVI